MSSFLKQKPIILASGSAIRLKLMTSLGLDFLVIPSECDEEKIKLNHKKDNLPDLGLTLARAKAQEVSTRYPDHFVIAADQLCVIDNQVLDKPLNHQTAIEHLQQLSGKEHQQIACVCIAKANKILWEYHDIAKVSLRPLNKENIEAYLKTEEPYQSCGAYQYETLGKWLFSSVQGNEDTILGLPLIALTNALIRLNAVKF